MLFQIWVSRRWTMTFIKKLPKWRAKIKWAKKSPEVAIA